MGRIQESLRESRRFLELDPLSPAANLQLGVHYITARQYDLAIEQERKTLQLDPNYHIAHGELGNAYWRKGMFDEAITEYEKQSTLSGSSSEEIKALRTAYRVSGWRGYQQKRLDLLLAQSKQSYASPFSIGVIYASLGEKNQALNWLEKADQERDDKLVRSLKVEPDLDSLRSDLRFRDLLARVGLPP